MFYLLIVSLICIIFSFAISFDNRNPYLCKSLILMTRIKEGSFAHRLFPHKEDELHPHSFLLIIPMVVSLVIFFLTGIIYVMYFVFNVYLVENFLLSSAQIFVSLLIALMYFLYPLVLLIINQIFEIKER